MEDSAELLEHSFYLFGSESDVRLRLVPEIEMCGCRWIGSLELALR